jgi:hypothetical protein
MPIARALGIVVALALAVGIRQASTVRMTPNGSSAAVLRLAWTARPDRIENCRTQNEQELAKLPAHMRQAVICDGTTAEYRLQVRRDNQTIVDRLVRGGGLRHDRPLYVFQDLDLAAGDVGIAVRFDRTGPPALPTTEDVVGGPTPPSSRPADALQRWAQMDPDRSRREAEERVRRREEAVPASLVLERELRLVARQVVLVTYDSERRELVVIERPSIQ